MRFSGPRLLVVVLLAIYLCFFIWYGGRGTPMSADEIDQRLKEIKFLAEKQPKVVDQDSGEFHAELTRLVANDDGKEFLMLNLINFRAKALYPPGLNYGDSALDADARYGSALVPYLLKYGGLPVFIGTPQGRFIHKNGDTEWQRVILVRYRSRRDLLKMAADVAPLDVVIHKWASIEKTQVFPVSTNFSLIMVRGLVAAILFAAGALFHFLFRRAAWYGRKSLHAPKQAD